MTSSANAEPKGSEPSSSECTVPHHTHTGGPTDRRLDTCRYDEQSSSEDSSKAECPQGNGSHCFEHGTTCCHCGANGLAIQRAPHLFPRPDPRPEWAPVHKSIACSGCDHPEHSSKCRELVSPDPFANVDECGCLVLTPMDAITRLCRALGGCPSHPVPGRLEPEDAPCEHGGGDMQDCPHGCAVEAPCVCGEPESKGVEHRTDGPCHIKLPPPEGSEYTPCVCGHIEPEHRRQRLGWTEEGCYECECTAYRAEEPEREPCPHIGSTCSEDAVYARRTNFHCDTCGADWSRWDGESEEPKEPCPHEVWEERNPGLEAGGVRMTSRWCTDCGAYLGRFEATEELPPPEAEEPAPPQPERRPPYAVAYAVQGHLYEVALPGDATVEAVDGALIIRHALGQVAGIVAVNPMSSKEEGK